MSGRIARFLLVFSVIGALLPVASLEARNPDASHRPRTSGPLLGYPFDCEDNGRASRGQMKAQACTWSYELIPAELDATNDFSAYWVQMEVDPGGAGWCAKEMFFEANLGGKAEIISATPSRSGRVTKARPLTRTLEVDGGGTAPIPGTVSQKLTSLVGRTSVRQGAHSYTYRWRGNSPHKVVTAIGLQFSRPTVPAEAMATWGEGMGVTTGTCRAQLIGEG